jgi:ubiquinone/menaquinone biosynthesis C-methylase UbiE
MTASPTTRFSNRVGDYAKYRPSYPPELMHAIATHCSLTSASHVADIGAGTGIFTALLLAQNFHVAAVEPNAPMRQAAEAQLHSNPKFQSLANSAENTGLPSTSIDAITVAQAFHWFNLGKIKPEWRRILRPSMHPNVALVWNDRRTAGDPFHEAYETLLHTYCPDYPAVSAHYSNLPQLQSFFAPQPVTHLQFSNSQSFDYPALEGRLRSSSYFPLSGSAHDAALKNLHALFDRHQQNGTVTIFYDTQLFLSHL